MNVVLLWSNSFIQELVARNFAGAEIIDRTSVVDQYLENPVTPAPQLIVCGPPDEKRSKIMTEVAQTLSMYYSDAKLLHVSFDRSSLNRQDLLKNGFTDVFLIPFESAEFTDRLAQIAASIGQAKSAYKRINLIDLGTDSELDFDTFAYLPMNKKFVRLSKAGAKFREDQLEKLKQHQFAALHIRQEDSQKFFKYTAQRLSQLGSGNNGMSETERRERLQTSVRTVISDLITATSASGGFDSGKQVLADCQEIVKSYVAQTNQKSATLFEKIANVSQTGADTYNHSTNVATLAALFSIALQIGKPDELALAGLLHDIGVTNLPPAVQALHPDQFGLEEWKEYRKHPGFALDILREKRLVLTERTVQIIRDHHERFDGTGYPAGLQGKKVLPDVQILSFADQFDELVAYRAGKPHFKPLEALKIIFKSEEVNLVGGRYDRQLLQQMRKFLMPENEPSN